MTRRIPFAWRLVRAALGVALLTALAGCTITFIGPDGAIGGSPARVIESFEVRGSSDLRSGQRIAFQIRTRLDGYVTLTSLDPDGTVNVFARNIPVYAGRTNVLDGSSQGGAFVVFPPRGDHRVRASFTTGRTDTSRVQFVGRIGESSWISAIRIDIEPFPTTDVAEARFSVR